MPFYSYAREDTGEIIEVYMTIKELMKRQDVDGFIVLDDGVSASRCFVEEFKTQTNSIPGNWPFASSAAGVNPDQVEETQKLLTKKGVKTNFTSDGRPIFTSARHRKKHCEAVGLFDRNAGHNDPVPQNN